MAAPTNYKSHKCKKGSRNRLIKTSQSRTLASPPGERAPFDPNFTICSCLVSLSLFKLVICPTNCFFPLPLSCTGLCALLLCLSTKGFPRQVDDIEFNSDLERSQLLLKESNSQTSFDSKANAQADNGLFEEDPEFMLVAPKDNSGTKHELPAPPKEVSVKKKTETLTGSSLKRARREIVEEGSGIFEGKQEMISIPVFNHVFVLRRALSAQIY